MSLWKMILAGVFRSWRVAAAVAMGVAIATAVIVGALLVGDSMRGSLRGLTIERLGNIESAVIPGSFFAAADITRNDGQAVAVILFDRGIAEARRADGSLRRAGNVQIIGCDKDFWSLDADDEFRDLLIDADSVVLNRPAADELGVGVDDLVTLRLPVEQAVPADSPLGRRDTESEGLPRLKVAAVIPDRGLGRFSLAASQAAPMNIYVSRQTIAETLDREGQANMLLSDQALTKDDLQLDLADFGLALRHIKQTFADDDTVFEYFSLTSDRLLLPRQAVNRIIDSFPPSTVNQVTTYLANGLEKIGDDGRVVASIPYSTITAIDSTDALPLDFRLPATVRDKEVVPLVLNSWAAEQLSASVGTQLNVAYYEPEVQHGREVERAFTAVVTDVVPITKPATSYQRNRPASFTQRPTVYNDPDLTPIVPGVTDQDSISDWDLPFQLQREISEQDDQYWNDYRLTPKAFLPLADGQRLFGSRFGSTTSLRIATNAADNLEELEQRLSNDLRSIQADLGWSVHAIRQSQLNASRGTTPFDGLFLSLSVFVILAAILLIAMLFRLGLAQRIKQFGTLLAVGWRPRRVAALALGEGLLIAAIGVCAGVAGGVGYAWLVLWALRNWLVGAVTVPFLTFHWTWTSLIVGAVGGWIVAALTLAVAVRWLTRSTARVLLSGQDPDSAASRRGSPKKTPVLPLGMAVAAVLIAGYGATLGGQAAAGAFVGGGTMLLIAVLIGVHRKLARREALTADHPAALNYSVGTLASRNGSRHPLRSTMTIGLMASAAFLIIAISAFRLQPSDAGTGGFALIAQTAQPVLRDLRLPDVRAEFLGADADVLDDTIIVPLRLKLGQDASCNNLYQATQPTVLGVPESFDQSFGDPPSLSDTQSFSDSKLTGFDWVGDQPAAWQLLDAAAQGTRRDPIPMIIDQNTAMWSLQMMQGIGEVKSFEYEPGQPVWFQVVGMLSNSMLQGKLLIGEANFERLFPDVNGYRYFLLAADDAQIETVARVLENRMGDFGMDVSQASDVLSGLMAVQNTYLRTFQSLGGLGLLLGTIGLAVAQARSVLERRQELAVMQAIGFTRRRLAAVVMTETAALLIMGVGCGVACAALVVIPHAWLSGLKPPIVEPIMLVTAIIGFGLIAGIVAVRRVIKLPLLESLRSE